MKITAAPDGPNRIGTNEACTLRTGEKERPPKSPFCLCRCGASRNKPLCDGSHPAAGSGAPGAEIQPSGP